MSAESGETMSTSALPLASTWGKSKVSVLRIDDARVAKVVDDTLIVFNGQGSSRIDYMIDRTLVSGVFVVGSPNGMMLASATSAPRLVFTSGTTVVDSGSSTQFRVVSSADRGKPLLASSNLRWTTDNPDIAVTDQRGVLRAVGVGDVTLRAVAGNVEARIRVTSRAASTNTVSMSPASASILVGQSVLFVVALRSNAGDILDSSTCMLTSSNGSIASVAGRSLVGIRVGTVLAIASCGTRADTAVVSVQTGGTSPNPPGLCYELPYRASTPTEPRGVAALPVAFPHFCITTPVRTLNVASGGNLQVAIDSAKPGDEIVLASGAVFVGNFILPAKAGSSWVTLRSGNPSLALTRGTRVDPSLAAGFAKILTANQNPALATAPGSARYYITQLEISTTATLASASRLLELGDGTSAQSVKSQVPRAFVVDQVYLHGTPNLELRRCLSLQSDSTAIVNSYVVDCNNSGFDSQAIGGWNGGGPYLIENNHLEAATEVLLFGGNEIYVPQQIPSDITVRRNHITRQDSFKGRWLVKNLVEFKSGVRALLEGNVVEKNWINGQQGWAFVITPDGPPGTWNRVSDITVRSNIFRKTGTWVQAGTWSGFPPSRISLINNLVYEINTPMYSGSGIGVVTTSAVPELELIGNTILITSMGILTSSVGFTGLTIRDNILGMVVDGEPFHTPQGPGTSGLNIVASGWTFSGNAFSGAWFGSDGSRYPAQNTFVAAGIPHFVSPTTGDYTLLTSSPFKGKASSGGDPGVNFASVMLPTPGVVR